MRTARRVRFSVRILNFALEPCPNTSCIVSFGEERRLLKSDGRGIVRFKSVASLRECHLTWVAAEGATEPIERTIEFQDSVASRLGNLGYEEAESEDDDPEAQFAREFGLSEETSEASRHEAIIAWHDRGEKPGA